MSPDAELEVGAFADVTGNYSEAPSASLAPSSSPTNLFVQHVGYVVRYAGEVRTVIRYPFQIDTTGEVLNMNGRREYELCEVDEVEWTKAEVSSRESFLGAASGFEISFTIARPNLHHASSTPIPSVPKQDELLYQRAVFANPPRRSDHRP